MKTSDVSVVIPCYNSEETIVRSLNSVLNQTLLPKEVIVIDDCSSDRSREVVEQFITSNKSGVSIELIKFDKNAGPAKARNFGWGKSIGKYIAFLDADDSWRPDKIRIQYEYMERNPKIDFSGHEYTVIDDVGDPLNETKVDRLYETEPLTKIKFLIKSRISTPTVMLKRSIEHRFPQDMKYAEDYFLWLQMICDQKNGVSIKVALTCLYKLEFGSSGLSSNMIEMYKGALKVNKKLYSMKHLSFTLFCLMDVYSTALFVRRLILVWSRINK